MRQPLIWPVYGRQNGPKSPFSEVRRATLQTSPRLFGQFLCSTLAIRLHSRGHRSGVLWIRVGLLPCPLPEVTREKSYVPTDPYVPPPTHLQRSGVFCRTRLPS